MQIQLAQPFTRTRAPRPALTTLAIANLIGIAAAFVYLQAAILHSVEMPLPIFAAISLVLGGVVALHWRWLPALGALWSAFLLAGNWSHMAYDLAHPESTHAFGFVVVLLALLMAGIVGGVAATVQNYRQPGQLAAPGWLRPALLVAAALIVGVIASAAIPRAAGASVAPEVLATLPGVPLSAYDGGTIRVKAGDLAALRLENPSSAGHSFDVDELNVHVGMPAGANSLALFQAAKPGTYLFYCAPHYNKATGTGMHGTLIIEP